MATLLPLGNQIWIDANGAPLAGGSVATYIPGTTTAKNTWLDSAQGSLNTNPITLDASGAALIFGTGTYRFIVKDVDGNLIWDVLSDEYASAIDVQNQALVWGGTSAGSANAQTLTLSNLVPGAYAAGQRFQFIAGLTNTDATTLNVNALGAVNILKPSSSGPVALSANDIFLGNVVSVTHDGTQFQLN